MQNAKGSKLGFLKAQNALRLGQSIGLMSGMLQCRTARIAAGCNSTCSRKAASLIWMFNWMAGGVRKEILFRGATGSVRSAA